MQYPGPVQQDGRLFDANPQIGGSRYNAPIPAGQFLPGNAIVSGTIRGGLAFQGFSPIPYALSFRGPMPSGDLSAFRRDSIAVADAYTAYPDYRGAPYLDPATTVVSSGYLSGYLGPSWTLGPLSNAARYPQQETGGFDVRLDPRVNVIPGGALPIHARSGPLGAQIVGLAPATTPELASSIFGPPQLTPQTPDVSAALGVIGLRPQPPAQQAEPYTGALPRLPVETMGARAPLGTPLEAIQQDQLQPVPVPEQEQAWLSPAQRGLLPLGPTPPEASGRLAPRPTRQVTPLRLSRDPSIFPGFELFNDMRLAQALEENPSAQWFEDLQSAILQDPVLSMQLDQQARMHAQEFVQSVLEAPIRTFQGKGDSFLNEELLKAEALLEVGEYYDAAKRYEAAQILDPANPLPLIGRGNALLAAGDYLRAAVALEHGFSRYPELARLKLDLQALMGGGEVVDMRRAELMQRLAGKDDAQLRFLLGYLEYYGGQPESGLQNLERAAVLAETGIISRFPAILREEGPLPPPELPLPETELPPARPSPPEPAVPQGR